MILPELGLPVEDVRAQLERSTSSDVDWRSGRAWSLVYDSPSWHAALVDEASASFMHENALSSSAYPCVQKFESEVIAMVSSVLSPGREAYGIFASGGTESILVAVKAYRDHPVNGKRSGRNQILLPSTAHPGFLKAAAYLELDTRIVEVREHGAPDVDEMLEGIGPETLMVGLSAPCFPFGVVDPISQIAGALAGGPVGVHVDAAMGGLFLPFLEGAGTTPPQFALDVLGVTSISVDLHKYGYGTKGASVVLFADAGLRRAAYFVDVNWPGGAYAASAVLGTRSVSSAAAAWTSMCALGRTGYRELVGGVMETSRRLQRALTNVGGLELVGAPPMGVFALKSEERLIAGMASHLQSKGWWIDTLSDPPALHFVVFPGHRRVVDELVADATEAVELVRSGRLNARALSSYGVMVRGDQITEELLKDALDQRFTVQEEPS